MVEPGSFYSSSLLCGNYRFVDEESTGRMNFCREITGSWLRNPPEKGNSARNYQLLDNKYTGRIEFRLELLAHGHGFRPERLSKTNF
jgi:hypothetical protein